MRNRNLSKTLRRHESRPRRPGLMPTTPSAVLACCSLFDLGKKWRNEKEAIKRGEHDVTKKRKRWTSDAVIDKGSCFNMWLSPTITYTETLMELLQILKILMLHALSSFEFGRLKKAQHSVLCIYVSPFVCFSLPKHVFSVLKALKRRKENWKLKCRFQKCHAKATFFTQKYF